MDGLYPKHIRKILEKANVAVLTPVFSTCDFRFVQSLANMIGHSTMNGVKFAGMGISHRSKTVSARNSLIKAVIDDKEITHFLLVDDDHAFKPNILCNLISREKDFICAVATQKVPPFYPVIYKCSKEEHLYHSYIQWPKSVFEIDACGFGFVLAKKSVFESMEYPWIEEKTGTYGHDLHFCYKLREKGIHIFCDGTQEVTHFGHTSLEHGVEDFKKYQKDLLAQTKAHEERTVNCNEMV